MNLSLKNRVAVSFGVATIVVLVLTFTIFNFLNSLYRDVEVIGKKATAISSKTDEVRISIVLILKNQRKLLGSTVPSQEIVDKISGHCEDLLHQLRIVDSFLVDIESKRIIERMMNNTENLQLILSKTSLFQRDSAGVATIGDLADIILDAYTKFQDIQYSQIRERDVTIKNIVIEAKRNMMITLIIGFLGAVILALVVPGKIALPFKKIKDAIRELQDCNFDVSIFYRQEDEIGEIAREMNKMIHSFKVFDELRTERIAIENRKFDALANMVKKPILVANAEGNLIYMNNRLYSLMQVQSEDVIGKHMTDTVISPTIISCYELAIKRRSKIENAEVEIFARKEEGAKELEGVMVTSKIAEEKEEGQEIKKELKDEKPLPVFEGYANVIPIRGKESSLDYYLMVLSTDVFV